MVEKGKYMHQLGGDGIRERKEEGRKEGRWTIGLPLLNRNIHKAYTPPPVRALEHCVPN